MIYKGFNIDLKQIVDTREKSALQGNLSQIQIIGKAVDTIEAIYSYRFVFELLQNARDANIDYDKEKKVSIELTDEAFIIKNTGKDFNEESNLGENININFISISDVLDSNETSRSAKIEIYMQK